MTDNAAVPPDQQGAAGAVRDPVIHYGDMRRKVYWLAASAIAVICALLSHRTWYAGLDNNVDDEFHRTRLEHLKVHGSLVSCNRNEKSRRTCKFNFLCFNADEGDFVFVHRSAHFGSGWPTNAVNREGRSQVVYLSTVGEHSQHAMSLMDLPADSLSSFDVTFIGGPVFVMKRFKPDNLMHALHDDLLPLYHELTKLMNHQHAWNDSAHASFGITRRFPVRLFFADDFGSIEDAGDDLYRLMSQHALMSKTLLPRKSHLPQLVCFEEAFAGFDRSTLWYQYGFVTPQGRLPQVPLLIGDVLQFASYVHMQLVSQRSEADPRHASPYALLLSRQLNRLILNEDELAIAIARSCSCRVHIAAAETHSLALLVALARDASIVVGMHGALLALAVFMSPGSVLIELFPYAINPDNYTPYATLADLLGLHYAAWQNRDRTATLGHPNRLPELGGLDHLNPDERRLVLEADEVPPHVCCSDPGWLYHIYQDTVVDSVAVAAQVASLQAAAADAAARRLQATTRAFNSRECTLDLLPTRPRQVTCSVNGTHLSAGWTEPWNLPYVNCPSSYEIVIENGDRDSTMTATTDNLYYTVRYNGLSPTSVWIRCQAGDTVGHWSMYVACSVSAG